MDNNLSKVADAMEAKRKAQIDDIEEKAKRAADALDKKEKITPPKEKKLREPKEKIIKEQSSLKKDLILMKLKKL